MIARLALPSILLVPAIQSCNYTSPGVVEDTVELKSSSGYRMIYDNDKIVTFSDLPPLGPIIEHRIEYRTPSKNSRCLDYGDIAWLSVADRRREECGGYEISVQHRSSSNSYLADAYLSKEFCKTYPENCADREGKVIYKIIVVDGLLASFTWMEGNSIKYNYVRVN
jgi:hypothetical protein